MTDRGLTSYLSVSAKIDWDADGDFTDSGEDVSADLRYPITTSRGRASATDQVKAGTGSFRLRNGDGTYNPFYTSSPLYPNVLPARDVKLTVTYNGVEYPLFRGRCSPDSGRFAPDGDISFTMIDAFEDFRKGKTSTSLLQDYRVDQVIAQVLDDIGDTALRSLDASPQTLGVFGNRAFKEDPLTVIQMATRQELGGLFFIARDGTRTFHSRDHAALELVFANLDGTFDDLVPSLRQEDLADTVRGAYARFQVASELSAIYTMSATGRPIYPGTQSRNRFEGTFNGVGAIGAIEPIASTDYTANDAADGTGADVTSHVTVDSLIATSKGFAIQFTSTATSVVYLTALQIRGYAIDGATEDNVIEATVASPVLTGQTLEETFEFNDDGLSVSGWVGWNAAVRAEMQPRITLRITPDTDALMAIVLGADIGKRVTLADASAPWLTQITGDWFIEAIDLSIDGPGEATATWTLFSEDVVAGSMAVISSDLDAIARKLMFIGDFAVIADDTSVTGAKVGY